MHTSLFRLCALSFLLSLALPAGEAARAAQHADAFDKAPDPAWWRPAQPEAVRIDAGRLTLAGGGGIAGRLEYRPALPADYSVRFDLRPQRERWRGYAFTVSARGEGAERPQWYVEFLGNGRAAAYGLVDGEWRHLQDAQPMPDFFDRDWRLTVRNHGAEVEILVEGLPEAGAARENPVVLQTKFRHDVNPGTETRLWLDCQNAEDMAVALSGWVFGGDLPALRANYPAPGGAAAAELKAPAITARTYADGRLFLFRPGAATPFASLRPEMQAVPDFKALAMTLVENAAADGRLRQRWRTEAFDLLLEIEAGGDPWVKIATAVENRVDRAGRVRVLYRFSPGPDAGEMTDLISFRKRWIHSTLPIAEKLDPLAAGKEWTWGTVAFSYPEEMIHNKELYEVDPITGALVQASVSPVDAYVPLAALHNDRAGLVVTVNPRAAFLFRAGPDGLTAGHIYYLPAERGFVDRGFFDGTGRAAYELYAGYPEKNDWGALWRDYYCAQNPWLREGPEAKALVTAESLPSPDRPAYAQMLRDAGVNCFGTGAFNMFTTREKIAAAVADPAFAATVAAGKYVSLWTNIFMAPDLDGHGKHWDPLLDYRNFKDSWVLGADGQPLKNWDGYLCTPAPEFSFAQFEFKRITDWMTEFGFNSLFLDLYAFNPDVDWNRTYEHLPFYPLQVATIKYCKMLSDWCVANGKVFILNCPHPSMMVWHLAHNFQGDTMGIVGDMSIVEKLACAAAGKPHTLLGRIEPEGGSGQWLEENIGAIFYGEIPSPWRLLLHKSNEELALDGALFGRNRRILDRVGRADILGGDLGQALWFAEPDGRGGYVTLANRETGVAVRRVRLDERAPLAPGRYRALLWDLTGPATVLADGDETLAGRTFEFLLPPKTVRVLCLVPPGLADELVADGNRPLAAAAPATETE